MVVYLHEAGRGGGAFFFVLFGLGIDLFHLFGILIIMIVIISIMKTRRIRIRRRFIFLSSLSSPKILISVLALLTRYRPQVNLHRGAFSTGLAHFRCQFSSVACVGLPALLIEGEGLGGDSVLSAVGHVELGGAGDVLAAVGVFRLFTVRRFANLGSSWLTSILRLLCRIHTLGHSSGIHSRSLFKYGAGGALPDHLLLIGDHEGGGDSILPR